MEQYNLITRFVLRLKFFLVKTLKKYLPHYYFDRWIEPLYYRLKRIAYKIHFWWVVSIRIRKRKSIVFISGEYMTPGHHYRVERYIEAYKSIGLQAIWLKPEAIFNNITILDRCVLLIIWRTEMSEHLNEVFNHARQNNIKVVYDIDDYMFNPEMARADAIDGIRSMNLAEDYVKEMYVNIRKAIDASDVCTCPTHFLASEIQKTGKQAFVLPNGYDNTMMTTSVLLLQNKNNHTRSIRIGYAGGTRTHQKDFRVALPALIRILNDFPDTILTVFSNALLLNEFEQLKAYHHRIELREMVSIRQLQDEIARFDINLAPLEITVFNDAKSELKYFEAALLQIPTVASPTAPHQSAITHGYNGFLAGNTNEWYESLKTLVVSPETRMRVGNNAFRHVLWNFGPEQRINVLYDFYTKMCDTNSVEITHRKQRNQAIEMRTKIAQEGFVPDTKLPSVPAYNIVKQYQKSGYSRAGVIIPVFNYEKFVVETLESVKSQTLKNIDLVIVEDCSTDNSLSVVSDWLSHNHQRFNSSTLIQNLNNSGLAATRNAAFDFIQVPYVMQLDADNLLLPDCLSLCLKNIENSGASLVYPELELFGEDDNFILQTYYTHNLGFRPWLPERLAEGNYIDAMAMVSKAAWYKTGGYDTTFKNPGWEDYDLWLKFIEYGLFGICVPKLAAKYRVHCNSMLREAKKISYQQRRQEIFERHPWVEKYEIKSIIQ